ncbi:MAG: hypothetical protein QNJ32_10545 [Xenococcaceae cyanobacterium MO_167.B27]|nr:hypothetical protein [Xenococcaceae cyanobacterium MO_167.B27]
MKVIICPGIHSSELTESFVRSVSTTINPNIQWLVLPTEEHPPYSPFAIYNWLNKPEILTDELLFITFSAGVVGGMGAAIALKGKGVNIKAFIAIDGWGVPLWGIFPLYRFSHDYFTHWSSAILGTGKASFYAHPPVEHLAMWRSPETCIGWIVSNSSASKVSCSAQDYLQRIIVDC